MLPCHASCVLSRLCCNRHSLVLGSYLSMIGKIKNPTCSAGGHLSSHSALSSYGLSAPLTLWRLFVSATSGSDHGELPGFWGSMVFRHAPIPWKGSGKQQQQISFKDAGSNPTDAFRPLNSSAGLARRSPEQH